MRAARYHNYGPCSVLAVEHAQERDPKLGQLRVRVVASAVNPVDCKIRRGDLRMIFPAAFPRTVGIDFAGVVDAVGPCVTGFRVGDEVFGAVNPRIRQGTAAEYAIVPACSTALKPQAISFEDAASIPISGVSALQSLRRLGSIRPGAAVLVVGATGGVGSFAVQIARLSGAHVVTLSNASHRERALALGSDVALDYSKEDPRSEGPYDIVLDTANRYDFMSVRSMLKPGGVHIATVPSMKGLWTSAWTGLFAAERAQVLFVRPCLSELGELASLMSTGKLKSIVAESLPLSAIQHAHTLMETTHVPGKIVLDVSK